MSRSSYINAQRAVIGCLLIAANKVAGPIFGSLRPDDFDDSTLRDIFEAARELFFAGKPFDPVILNDALGGSYAQVMADLMRETPYWDNYEDYAKITREQAQIQKLALLGGDLMSEYNDLDTCRDLVSKAALVLSDDGGQDDSIPIRDVLDGFFDRLSGPAPPYLPWGFAQLDKELHAEIGDFVILGGYPSAGKTALSIQAALNMARKGYRVGYFSLETNPRTKLADRLMSHVSQVPLAKIKTRDLSAADMAALQKAGEELYNLPIEFYRAGGYSVADVQAKTLNKRFQVILIDYLQLLRAPGKDLREQVTNVSIALHTLCQKHNVTAIALSQLTRPDKKDGKPQPPTMASLRESGQLEQDADVIFLVYKDDPKDPKSQRVLDVAKNKEGELGFLKLDFDGATQTFRLPRRDWKDRSMIAGTAKIRADRQIKHYAQREQEEASLQVKIEELGDGKDGDLPF